MNYEERDPYGMYTGSSTSQTGPDARHGPGPHLMGADTLVGNDVYNRDSQDLGAKTHWPDMADATWEKGIHAYYGTKPYAADQRA